MWKDVVCRPRYVNQKLSKLTERLFPLPCQVDNAFRKSSKAKWAYHLWSGGWRWAFQASIRAIRCQLQITIKANAGRSAVLAQFTYTFTTRDWFESWENGVIIYWGARFVERALRNRVVSRIESKDDIIAFSSGNRERVKDQFTLTHVDRHILGEWQRQKNESKKCSGTHGGLISISVVGDDVKVRADLRRFWGDLRGFERVLCKGHAGRERVKKGRGILSRTFYIY